MHDLIHRLAESCPSSTHSNFLPHPTRPSLLAHEQEVDRHPHRRLALPLACDFGEAA